LYTLEVIPIIEWSIPFDWIISIESDGQTSVSIYPIYFNDPVENIWTIPFPLESPPEAQTTIILPSGDAITLESIVPILGK
jgi:hypothetical protein